MSDDLNKKYYVQFSEKLIELRNAFDTATDENIKSAAKDYEVELNALLERMKKHPFHPEWLGAIIFGEDVIPHANEAYREAENWINSERIRVKRQLENKIH